MGLTPKQKELLSFIEKFQNRHGHAPSQQEIANHFGFKSLGTVQNYLVRLEQQGALARQWNGRRSVQLTPPAAPQIHHSSRHELPLLGRVAAGRPIEIIEIPETITVPPALLGRGEHFVLQVTGDSMKEDGILNGDHVVIQKRQIASDGQTVVAFIDGNATLKRFFRHKDHIELRPAHAEYVPLKIPYDSGVDFKIGGILVGLIRKVSH